MSDYDTDTLIWSEHQADLLRRLAAGDRTAPRLARNGAARAGGNQ